MVKGPTSLQGLMDLHAGQTIGGSICNSGIAGMTPRLLQRAGDMAKCRVAASKMIQLRHGGGSVRLSSGKSRRQGRFCEERLRAKRRAVLSLF
ncbi:hypothetical protein NL676_019861 [Syzygium grande]|nr:hypothetical protein NL676_019861 [Syzygium grande]